MKHYIVFNSGQDYHAAEDVVVRFLDHDQEDPRSPEDGVRYRDISLSDLILAMENRG